LAPDLEPEGDALEEDPAIGTDALAKPAVGGPGIDPGDSAAGDLIGIGSDEHAELALAVVGGVDEDDFTAEGADGDGGPADELDGGPAFKLDAGGASFADQIALFVEFAGMDERHVVAAEPEFDHAALSVGDEDAKRGAGAEKGAFGGLDAEDDAFAGCDDPLHGDLLDLDVIPKDTLGGGGQFGSGRFEGGATGIDGGAAVGIGAAQVGFGADEFGGGSVAFEGGQFELALGGETAPVAIEGFDPVELEASGLGGETGGVEAGLGAFDGQSEGTFEILDLAGEGSETFLGSGLAGDGFRALETQAGNQVRIIVDDLEKGIALADGLAFDNEGFVDPAGEGGLDADGSFEGVIGDDATLSGDELLPGEKDHPDDEEDEKGGEDTPEDAGAADGTGEGEGGQLALGIEQGHRFLRGGSAGVMLGRME